DLLGGEAAELAAAEEAAILVAAVLLGELAAFTFGTSAGRGHACLSLRRRGLRGGSAFGRLRFGTGGGAGRAIGHIPRLLFLHHGRGAGDGFIHLDGEVAEDRVVELERVLELDE